MDELARQPRHGPHFVQLQHLLNDLQNHQAAWPFLQPVNRDEVPDYYNVILEPMDLSTMESKLESDLYETPEDFVYDANLIFKNCKKYNNETTTYYKNAVKLEKFFNNKLREIPEWSVSSPFHNIVEDHLLTSCSIWQSSRCLFCSWVWISSPQTRLLFGTYPFIMASGSAYGFEALEFPVMKPRSVFLGLAF